MLNIRNILFPTDYSNCAAQALEHAIYLANYYRAKLHVIHVNILDREDPQNPDHHLPETTKIHEQLNGIARERMNSNLQAYVKGFREEVINMEVLRGFSAADLILQYASERDIDLIVMGTHGAKGMQKIFSNNEFADAYEATKRIALKSFANDDVYLEKFLSCAFWLLKTIQTFEKVLSFSCKPCLNYRKFQMAKMVLTWLWWKSRT